MSVVICPGIHDPGLTMEFLAGLKSIFPHNSKLSSSENILLFSDRTGEKFTSQGITPTLLPCLTPTSLSAFHILQFLSDALGNPLNAAPVVFIGFSAGVVGAIGAAWGWQMLGGKVKAAIALDGWGVPLFGHFPCHRLSHDFFTHWSSSLLGSGEDSFYADPSVEHLTMWRSPQTVTGWWIQPSKGRLQPQSRLTAAEFLTMLLKRYGEIE